MAGNVSRYYAVAPAIDEVDIMPLLCEVVWANFLHISSNTILLGALFILIVFY